MIRKLFGHETVLINGANFSLGGLRERLLLWGAAFE